MRSSGRRLSPPLLQASWRLPWSPVEAAACRQSAQVDFFFLLDALSQLTAAASARSARWLSSDATPTELPSLKSALRAIYKRIVSCWACMEGVLAFGADEENGWDAAVESVSMFSVACCCLSMEPALLCFCGAHPALCNHIRLQHPDLFQDHPPAKASRQSACA